ncbi:MAG: ATP-binding cassette domain-containing protein [Alicyclobacillus shizuokensis]|nr:ATP-binding cassette domain-containing protein [Alicyclobacillus shizuokensis]
MPNVIKAQGLSKEWAGKSLFTGVDFEIAEGERVALFGRNGVGKTTLLRGLMDDVTFDTGTIWRRYPLESWGWLQQHLNVETAATLQEFVQSGHPRLFRLRQQLDALQEQLEEAASGSDGEGDTGHRGRLNQLAEAYSALQERYLALDGYTWELQVEQTLSRFGFAPAQHAVPYGRLSGGEKTRAQQALYDKQQREKQALLEAIRRYREWYQQAHDAAGVNFHLRKKAEKNSTRFKAKERALERLEAEMVERPKADPSLCIEFREGLSEAKTLLTLHDVAFQYTAKPLFDGLNLRVQRGDRIAVIGGNGMGKTTLLKLMTGRLQPQRGRVDAHPALNIGYFAQELEDLDLSRTVLDTLLVLEGMTQSYARTVLAGFLFPREDVFKRVGDLSMGERCRVAFVKLYFSGANLLVLDEPTNYLDIDARERIEEALRAYPGALLVASHDRYLVRRVANRILHLEPHAGAPGTQVTLFPGPYDEWLQRLDDPSDLPVHVRDRIRQLEYQLVEAVAREEDSADEEARIAEIRHIREQLNQLRENRRRSDTWKRRD